MSNDAGDASSRLSDALDEIFSGTQTAGRDDAASAAADGRDAAIGDASVDNQVEPYELPQIIPATADTPRLPERAIVPEPATSDARVAPGRATVIAPAVVPTEPAPASPTAKPAPQSTRPATGWGDLMPAQQGPATSQLRAPGRRPRVRRVTRVVRHIDPWSTFKVALIFNAVAYVVCLTSGVLLWRVADSTGTLDNVERWFTQFGWETFELDGGAIFHNAWIIGLFCVVAATGAAVLLATLFNLVSDIVGGVRLTVLEEEVVERTISSTRRYVVRRPADASNLGSAATSDWSADDLDADDLDDREDRLDTIGGDDTADDAGDLVGSNGTDGVSKSQSGATTAGTGSDWSVD